MTTHYAIYAPLERWLVLLAQGWRLPFVAGMTGHHGRYAVLLWRPG